MRISTHDPRRQRTRGRRRGERCATTAIVQSHHPDDQLARKATATRSCSGHGETMAWSTIL